jgi:hypothetical protein
MAQALLRALDRALRVEATFDCRLLRGAGLSESDTHVVRAEIVPRPGADAEQLDVRLQLGAQSVELRAAPGPDGRAVVEHPFSVPTTMPAGRAFAIPVHLHVRDSAYGSFDTAWLTIAPAIGAPRVESTITGAERTWHHLGADALTIGRHLWRGEDDLSARFALSATPNLLRLEVHVIDDDITVADLEDPARGDSVEVYLDLRGEGAQGLPVYGPDVLALQIIPPADGQVRWRNLHALPDDLRNIDVAGAISDEGYRIRVQVPLAAIEARRGPDYGGIGIDVGVNDADGGGWRRCQMMWAGTGENYINPGFLGGVWPGAVPAGATRRVLR